MDSETTRFLAKAAASSLPCFWVPDSCCSMKGEGNQGGKKRRLTVDQVRLLEKNFNDENKLEHDRKVQIAEEIGLRPRQVAVWFQNRRARSKTKRIEKDYESLNAEYDKLKNDFDSLLKLNQELKAEVWSLFMALKTFRSVYILSSLSFSFSPILIRYPLCVGFQNRVKISLVMF